MNGRAALRHGAVPERADDTSVIAAAASRSIRPQRAGAAAAAVLLGLAVLLWIPRASGPVDLRWDGAVYYILGSSLAQGTGYRLLNEPGQIEAVQYPPLLPALVAVHQRVLGTDDPTIVGRMLRLTAFVLFVAYVALAWRFLRTYLPVGQALVAALLSILCLHAWFLSDLLFPEIAFACATLLFLSFARRRGRRDAALSYVFAVASYALRTVGIVALVTWVLDAALRARFREASLRAAVALVPIVAWQAYVGSVERSPEYSRPAYAYQRAAYMFYNVSYARNVVLRDPFTPEKGQVQLIRRAARNALDVPASLGETLMASRRYLQMGLHGLVGSGAVRNRVIDVSAAATLVAFGLVFVFGGLAVLAWRREPLVPLYLCVYVAALCVTPFPGQYLRYLMPVAPLLALCALVSATALRQGGATLASPTLRALTDRLPAAALVCALAIQAIVAATVYAREYRPVSYVDAYGRRLTYRLFFYDESQQGFDEAVGFVQADARPSDVVAAGTPHWIYLRTRLHTVMPPFEKDVETAQRLLDTVPVRYLLVGEDVVGTERYMVPVVERFSDRWELVYSSKTGGWRVYRRRAA